MRSVNRWSRRAVLGAAAVAGVGATGLIARSWFGGNSGRGSDASFPELLRQSIFDLDIPCNSAESYLSDQVSGGREHDISGIVALVRKRLDMHGNSVSGYPGNEQRIDVEGLIRLLAKAIKEDFATDQLCVVEGWQLSMTECRLGALKFLWERNHDGGTDVVCRKTPLYVVATPPKLSKIVPRRTIVGVPFTVQPNGSSVINVYGTDFQPGAKILLDGVPLHSAVGHSGWMNAYVPEKFYAIERIMDVEVKNPDGTVSNGMEFAVIRAVSSPPPKLSRIVPSRTFIGVPFTVQPNGKSVINVYGTGFQSGAQILFDDVPLESAVGHSGWMNAYVPAKFYSRKRIMDVVVRNPDGKGSNPIRFAVVSNSD